MRVVSGPIVHEAKWAVFCPCGFKHDSAEETAPEALTDMAQRHQCEHPGLLGVAPKESTR